MPFKKGHKPDPEWRKGGRPSNKHKTRRKTKNHNSTIDRYVIHKYWEKRTKHKIENIDDIDWYINNDIPLDEYYKNNPK